MTFVSGKYYRNSLRLRDYDYSQNGMYFITICNYQMQCLFGRIKNGEMYLNKLGIIAYDELQKTPKIRTNVKLGDFIIMPNHIHVIIYIVGAYCNTPLRLTKDNVYRILT